MAVRRLECQPGPVGAVRVFEAYNITVFHWSTILCIAGIDLEKGFGHGQRVASSFRLVGSPKNKGGTKIKRIVNSVMQESY